MSNDFSHPLKRIRESLLNLSDESGMKNRASIAGFAKWLGRSESLIRNVENGCTTFSKQLARLVELKTGVSADWMLSDEATTSEILSKDGAVWNAADFLDPYAKGGLLSSVALIMESKPELVPPLVGAIVEARIFLEMALGNHFVGQQFKLIDSPRGLRGVYEGHSVLQKVLKAVMGKGSFEMENLENCLQYILQKDRPTDELRKAWGFLSMLEGGAVIKLPVTAKLPK